MSKLGIYWSESQFLDAPDESASADQMLLLKIPSSMSKKTATLQHRSFWSGFETHMVTTVLKRSVFYVRRTVSARSPTFNFATQTCQSCRSLETMS